MSSISGFFKGFIGVPARFLNQPEIKSGVKNSASPVTFGFGFVGVYTLYKAVRERNFSTESNKKDPKWLQIADNVCMACSKISLVLSGVVSRPGVAIISNLVGKVVSDSHLNRAFGANTIFAINPWHPRHVASFVAAGLAVPSLALSIYKTMSSSQQTSFKSNTWLADKNIRRMTLFNTIFSRPVLHMGNQLAERILRSR